MSICYPVCSSLTYNRTFLHVGLERRHSGANPWLGEYRCASSRLRAGSALYPCSPRSPHIPFRSLYTCTRRVCAPSAAPPSDRLHEYPYLV